MAGLRHSEILFWQNEAKLTNLFKGRVASVTHSLIRKDAREEFSNSHESLVTLREHPGKEIKAVRHTFADEMFNGRFCSAQLLSKGPGFVDQRIGSSTHDQRRRIACKFATRRTGMRMGPVFVIDQVGAADELAR